MMFKLRKSIEHKLLQTEKTLLPKVINKSLQTMLKLQYHWFLRPMRLIDFIYLRYVSTSNLYRSTLFRHFQYIKFPF